MMDAHPEEHQDLRLKIKWLMALRVSVVTLLLGVSIFLQIGFGREGKTNELFYYLIAGTYFLTLLYSFLLTRLARVVQLAKFQIGIDLLFITGLVYLTGGVESPFAVFFMVSTISGSMLLGKRGGWNAAFASAVLLAGLVYIQHYSPTTILSAKTSSSKEAFYLLFLDFLALLAVAYLSGSLAQKLSVVQGRLDEKTTGFAELKAFHECVVQSMSSGLLTTGLGGEITSFNRTAEEITGLRFYDVQGKPWWEVLGAEDLKHLFEADQPIKEPVRFDRTFFRNDGNRLLLGLTVSPLKNEEGIQIGSVWTFQNLTRIREMEEEIENKKRLATIGEMAAGMAHEIRNPLAALSGSIQVLHKGKKLEGREAKQLMSIALKETNRLDSIIKSFLLYARPAPLNKKPTDINRLIKETVNLMENSRDFPEKIRIRLDLNPGRLNVTIDPDRIRQVLWNLSNNAVEAMPDGGVLSVATRSPSSGTDNKNPDPKWVEILFSDSGQGIEEEHLKKIFFPFFTTKDHGSGLGLPIVYRIMEEHRGRIHVTSQAQKGTQIMLLLPLAGEEVSAVPTH